MIKKNQIIIAEKLLNEMSYNLNYRLMRVSLNIVDSKIVVIIKRLHKKTIYDRIIIIYKDEIVSVHITNLFEKTYRVRF